MVLDREASTLSERDVLVGFSIPGGELSLLGNPKAENEYKLGHLKEFGFDVSKYAAADTLASGDKARYAMLNEGYHLTNRCYQELSNLIGEAKNAYDTKSCAERIALCFENLQKDLVFNNVDLEQLAVQGFRVLAQLKHRHNLQRNELHTIVKRFTCPDYWLKVLNKNLIRNIDNQLRARAHVSKNKECYISDVALNHFRIRQTNQKNIIDSLQLVDKSNPENTVPLSEIIEKSLANGANRRAELMVRISGMEEVAKEQNWVGNFYTITAPSKYHPTSRGKLNKKYQGATVRETMDYLNGVWQKIRAQIDRETDNRYFGVRVCEPHTDGTPHWHLLIFADQSETETITRIMRDYSIAEDRAELRKDTTARFDVVKMEKGRKATGYISKYVSKNIDGFGVDFDNENDLPAATSAERVIAWARVHGIRQFQTFGLPPIGIYRELRKVRKEQSGALEYYERVRAAADASNYAEVITECWINDFSVKRKRLFDPETGEILTDNPDDVVTRYGDLKHFGPPESVTTETLNIDDLITRTTEWTLERREEPGVKERRAAEYDRAISDNKKRQTERRLNLGLPPTNPQDF